MKEKIHPKFFETTVNCVCGETFITGSTKQQIKVDICSKCHPFFTGQQKLLDSEGRVERFNRKTRSARIKKTAIQPQPQTEESLLN